MEKNRPLKFIVQKGIAGFGDRLQCLLQAITYAKATNRILVVDWRDSHWTHNEKINADYFFKIEGLSYFPFEAFSIYFQQKYDSVSVFPDIWKDYLLNKKYEEFIYKKIFQVPGGKENLIRDIANMEKRDFSEDVVVLPGVGVRTFNYEEFQSIKFDRWVINQIQGFVNEKKLISKKYDVIHLRAGSKSWAGGSGGHKKDYIETMEKKFPDLEAYFEKIFDAYEEKLSISNFKSHEFEEQIHDCPVYLLSDSDWIIEKWLENYGIGTFLKSQQLDFNQKSGLHELSEKELKNNNVEKIELNYDMLLDFHVLLNARHVIFDGITLFSKMASKIGNYTNAYYNFDNENIEKTGSPYTTNS